MAPGFDEAIDAAREHFPDCTPFLDAAREHLLREYGAAKAAAGDAALAWAREV